MPYNLTTMQSIYHNQDEIVEITYNGSPVYQKSSGPDYTEPFYVENISNADETLNIVKYSSSAPTLTIEYSINKTTWNTLGTTSTTPLTRTLTPGEKIYLKCSTDAWSLPSSNNYNKISGTSKIGGNIMSLLYGDNFAEETDFPSGSTHNFWYLFRNNTILVNASKILLPVNTLTRSCYGMMFNGCRSLTQAPALPATTLKDDCYAFMFQNCTSLTQAPALPATTLPAACYSRMFSGCTALVQPPVLPASKLVSNCYSHMFQNCTSLNKITCYATSQIDWYGSLTNWLSNTSSTGTFTKAAGVEWPTGDSGIPSGWTVVEV